MIAEDKSRLRPRTISQDVDSLNYPNTISDDNTVCSQAVLDALQQTYQVMLAQQRNETERLLRYRAATDAVRLAEWQVDNAGLAMEEVAHRQSSLDGDEAQAIELKQKSDRKRSTRRKTSGKESGGILDSGC
jgi:hypothetical protein